MVSVVIDSPVFGEDLGFEWHFATSRNRYVCDNNVTFRPRTGEPLKAGHKYAFIITNKVMAKDKTTPVAAPADQVRLFYEQAFTQGGWRIDDTDHDPSSP